MSAKSWQVAMAGWMLLVFARGALGQTTRYVDDNNCPGPGTGAQADPFCSIQRGIDVAVNGDEVLVAVGTYNETINFNGKTITLRSSDGPHATIIDGVGLNDTVVRCTSGEPPETILRGFTITGGLGVAGGGMLNVNSTPTVTNCIFFGNVTIVPNPLGDEAGGGMYNVSSSPTVNNCVFRQNTSIAWGGGGGGMFNSFSANPTITNCTFFENDAGRGGAGGMLNSGDSNPIVSNCIFWGNVDPSGPGESVQIRGPAVVNHSCIQGGWTGAGGVGNVDADPLFFDPDGPDNILGTLDDDLRLLPGSAAIDAGDNAAVPPDVADIDGDNDITEPTPVDLDGNPRFVDAPNTPDTGNGTPPIVDMGAFEFQPAPIPAVSQWGLVILALLLLAASSVVFRRRRSNDALPHGRGSLLRALGALLATATWGSVAQAELPVGPQIRIDVGAGTASGMSWSSPNGSTANVSPVPATPLSGTLA